MENTPLFSQKDLIHGEFFQQHDPKQLTAGNTPTGHIIIFMAPGDSYPKIMREQHQITKEMYFEHQLEDLVLRQLQVDRLTRKHQRLIKQCVIVDCKGIGSTNLMDSIWNAWDKEFNVQIRQTTHVEYVGRIFVLNIGWMARSVYTAGKYAIPARTRNRIFLYGTDYRTSVLKFISTRTLQTLLTFRKNKVENGEDGTENSDTTIVQENQVDIAAGSDIEKVISLNGVSKLISWKFNVLSRDIKFSVWLYTEGNDDSTGETKEKNVDGDGVNEICIVEELTIQKSTIETIGEYKVDNNCQGLLILRWSNKHSWMRTNQIKYEYSVVDV